MKKYSIYIILLVAFAVFSSCATIKVTKQEAFPKMYEENPISILVAPPINNETAAEAGDFYLSTIAVPTTLQGYYIMPIPVITELLKNEGVYNTIQEIPQPAFAKKMFELCGADATLFTTILKWDKKYRGITGWVEVLIDYRLVSGETGELLWSHAKEVKVNTDVDTGVPGLAGLIVDAAATAVKTAVTDYVPVAREANQMALIACPYGKYHKSYLTDKNTKVVVYKSKIEETGAEISK